MFLDLFVELKVHVVSIRSIQVYSSPVRSPFSLFLLHGHGADTLITLPPATTENSSQIQFHTKMI